MVFWILFGWFADYSFPYTQALDLIIACFKGSISIKINVLQKQLQRTEIVTQADNEQQVRKLNNLESQAWLYQNILEILGRQNADSHERIAKTIEALEFKRSEITQELEPRKPEKYRTLDAIQDFTRSLIASQAQKDYIRLEKIVSNLVNFARSRQPSRIIFEELLEKLNTEIVQNASQISPYRLRLAYKIEELIRIISFKIILYPDNNPNNQAYQDYVNELNSQIRIISEEFNNILGKNEDNISTLNRINSENNRLNETIFKLRGVISERDTSIASLNQEIINTKEVIQNMRCKVDVLEEEIARLNNQKQDFQRQQQQELYKLDKTIDELHQDISKRDTNITSLNELINTLRQSIQDRQNQNNLLQGEIDRLNSQKQYLHQQNNILTQNNRHKQQEIERLNEKLSRKIETRNKLTLEEYKEIYNQNDYEYVSAYTKKDGTFVNAYYRRKRRR